MSVVIAPDIQNNLVSLLLKRRLISPTQVDLAQQIQKRKGEPVERILIHMGWVKEADINTVLGELWDLPVLNQEHLNKIEPQLLTLISEDLCRKYTFLPLWRDENHVWTAMCDPYDLVAIDDLQRLIHLHVKPVLGTKGEILKSIEAAYKKKPKEEDQKTPKEGEQTTAAKEEMQLGIADIELELQEGKKDEEDETDTSQLRTQAGDPPVVKMVNFMIVRAIEDRASDIHVEPKEDGMTVRYRVDGSLFELIVAPKHLKSSITSRLKILSGMDIAVKRVPQDGSFSIQYSGAGVDFRVNSLPTIYGEKIVLRLLRKNSVLNNKLINLGLGERMENLFRKYMHRPHGMILVTGPTGSGKSTTLYTVLNEIKSPRKNIITVEDPAEYRLPGIQQVQVKSDIGFEFADALRAILRQDPDVIMIGEIRDQETAHIAVKSSLTGHLVLSTLHTNDATGAIIRLIDIGLEPFLVVSSVTLAIAQRLVKRICPECKEKYSATEEEKTLLGLNKNEEIFLYRGKGCPNCRNSGYIGRLAIFEIFEMTPAAKTLLLDKNSSMDMLRTKAIEEGMETLKSCGVRRALEGMTTVEEVLATCVEGE
ncbi:MAG: Flp pilus assembly complex ATPase component TadA [Candidatus Schekmanbacteria bacterium]|nr:Flp pilus assembly complex ATPase component TadA [Candidatus Schekmanbacteria bacterium]